MRFQLALAIGVVVLLATSRADDKDKPDQDKIQGNWTVTGLEVGGKALPEDDVKKLKVGMTFQGDKYTLSLGDQKGTFKLDEKAKPRQITLTAGEQKIQAIYQLDGDMLKLCHEGTGKEPPKDFATKKDSALILFVLKRDK